MHAPPAPAGGMSHCVVNFSSLSAERDRLILNGQPKPGGVGGIFNIDCQLS
ncbi:Uncharacterized protein dnm_087770 [Desulfonema magnum]|uniref:Uncharacterized protein n=1 Tax=Desulfonema magnum TaxID=45655 RepID=A0A975BVW6_9BACT|nr:Uncharacterized protein dnm_087770 [Desulfonema magnum]